MFTRYQPRALRYLGPKSLAGHQLKTYAIAVDESAFAEERFREALRCAAAELPPPDAAAGRPGLGFLILHQGRTGDYLILSWWDRENELPTRVLVRDGEDWRPARDGESFCVWDLRVIWWEREAYVGTMLADRPDGRDRYLAAAVAGFA